MQGAKPMRLVVKKDNGTVSDLRFSGGPIYIGRHNNSQVLLPDRTVSRQHALIFSTEDGKWMAEDLDSANKTYLNGKAIHKAEIKTGDCLRIADFTIEVYIEDDTGAEKSIHLEDTLTTATRDLQIIVRKPDVEHAPDIKLPAKRARDFLHATEAICKVDGLDEVLHVLLGITSRQFDAYHTWCALRNQASGPMTCHAGKGRDGRMVKLSDIKLNEKINQAVERGQFLLLPQVSTHIEDEKIRSAMIAPVLDPTGCFGVLYVDNTIDREPYSLSDLDYLMLLAIHTAAILENF
jgi:hypothetical protein